jgi:hypothetical protein
LAILPCAEPTLLPSRKRPPHRRGSARAGGPSSWSWQSRMSECLPCRSSVPLSVSLPVRHGVPGGVDGVRPDRPDMRCPDGCPIVASIVDAGHDRADIGRERLCTCRHPASAQMVTMGGPDASSGWDWPKASMRMAVLTCPVMARTCRPRGWPWPLASGMVGRWALEVSAACRRCPDRVQTHRPGRSPRTGGVRPTGRWRGPPCPLPGQRLPGVRRGTARRRRCPDGCPAAAPWRRWAASRTAGVSGTPWRGPGGRHRAVQG